MEEEQVQAEIDKLKAAVKLLGDAIKSSVAQQLAAASTATGDIIDARAKSLATDIAEVERGIEKLKARQEKLEDNDQRQTAAIEELLSADRQIYARIEETANRAATNSRRLDGTIEYGSAEAISIETLRGTVTRISDQLGGSGDQLPYSEVRSSIANTKLLGSFMKGFLALFGTGSVIGFIGLITGFGKPIDYSAPIAKLEADNRVMAAENKNLKESITSLERRINNISDRQATVTTRSATP